MVANYFTAFSNFDIFDACWKNTISMAILFNSIYMGTNYMQTGIQATTLPPIKVVLARPASMRVLHIQH